MAAYPGGDAEDMGEPAAPHVTQSPGRGRHVVGRHREPEPPSTVWPATGRDAANLARDHELARMRAKFIDGATAWPDLVERLNFAHLQAGKPALGVLAAQVRYSKATLSKVLGSKMMPSWTLVRLLGQALRVPSGVVMQEWLPLWTAAERHRAKRLGAIRGTAKVPAPTGPADPTGTSASAVAAIDAPTGYTCFGCGSWVVNTTVHTEWHMRMEATEPQPPADESVAGRLIGDREIRLLREALGQDEHPV